jgi:hypothetical protein
MKSLMALFWVCRPSEGSSDKPATWDRRGFQFQYCGRDARG